MIEVNRNGKITKFAYDGFGMLVQKTFHDGSTEVWVWDGLALIRRGSDIYVNEPHVSGGVPILSKTDEGVRYHEHDFLGTTLWSSDRNGAVPLPLGISPLRRCYSQIGYSRLRKGTTRIIDKSYNKDYQDTTIFGEGSIQKDRFARFTGKPYDEDLQAYVFPYRNYDASTARWRSSDPAGYPDDINNQFYAAVPTYTIDMLGTWIVNISITFSSPNATYTYSIGDKQMYVPYIVNANVSITKEKTDKDNVLFMYENIGNIGIAGTNSLKQSGVLESNSIGIDFNFLINPTSAGDGLKRAFSTINIYSNDGRNIVKIGSKTQESIWNLKGVEK